MPQLRAALAADGHAVLVAPPGSGKTTIVPLRLLDEPWLEGRRITVLEPRRLATRAAARRMAFLLGEEAGDTVGYVTRTDRRIGRDTRIEVVTEGVLTRRLQRDPELPGVGLVVFDEFHERNLQTESVAVNLCAAVRRELRRIVLVTSEDVVVRMSAIDESIWPPAPQKEKQPPNTSLMVPMTDFVSGGAVAMPDVLGPIYDEINQRYGTNISMPTGGGH